MEEHLPQTRLTAEAVDALALEQDDFLASIRGPRAPRVTGQQARDAVAVVEGYPLVVKNGRQFLGMRRRVRVETAIRSGGTAVIVGSAAT